jgi:hypothetical protein
MYQDESATTRKSKVIFLYPGTGKNKLTRWPVALGTGSRYLSIHSSSGLQSRTWLRQ